MPEEEWIVQGVCAYVPQVRSLHVGCGTTLTPSTKERLASQRFDQRSAQHCSLRVIFLNAFLSDNILFDLPFIEERYQKTLEVESCGMP